MSKSAKKPGLALTRDAEKEIVDRAGDPIGIEVVESAAGPFDAYLRWRPDPEERFALWEGKPPPFDEVWHRRMYDMNKELADRLRNCSTIKVGRLTARTLRRKFLG